MLKDFRARQQHQQRMSFVSLITCHCATQRPSVSLTRPGCAAKVNPSKQPTRVPPPAPGQQPSPGGGAPGMPPGPGGPPQQKFQGIRGPQRSPASPGRQLPQQPYQNGPQPQSPPHSPQLVPQSPPHSSHQSPPASPNPQYRKAPGGPPITRSPQRKCHHTALRVV